MPSARLMPRMQFSKKTIQAQVPTGMACCIAARGTFRMPSTGSAGLAGCPDLRDWMVLARPLLWRRAGELGVGRLIPLSYWSCSEGSGRLSSWRRGGEFSASDIPLGNSEYPDTFPSVHLNCNRRFARDAEPPSLGWLHAGRGAQTIRRLFREVQTRSASDPH